MTTREAADAMACELARLQELSACQEDVDSIDAVIDAYRTACEAEGNARTWQVYASVDDSKLYDIYRSEHEASLCEERGTKIIRATVTEVTS